jgi:hypothetical protein
MIDIISFMRSPLRKASTISPDRFGKIPEFKFCAAKVERVEPVREAAE